MERAATRQGKPYLKNSLVFSDLYLALAPYNYVVGTTARLGEKRGSIKRPRELAPMLLRENIGKVAILFGTKREGLTNPELRLYQQLISIPTESQESSSLNLSQALLILGYELLIAAEGNPPPAVSYNGSRVFRSRTRIQRSGTDLDRHQQTLTDIEFLPSSSGHWIMNVKKIFNRTLLSRGECDLIQGICRQIRYKISSSEKKEP
jgi:tRNA/rRNA methyltransferase